MESAWTESDDSTNARGERPMTRGLACCLVLALAAGNGPGALGSSWMDKRIDPNRKEDAHKVCEFVVSRIQGGRYHPPEALFAETSGYQASMAATLSLAGKMLDEPRYVETASDMFDQLLETRVEDMWSLDWWCAYPIFRAMSFNWKEQNRQVNDRYTVLVLYCLGLHHRITGEERYLKAGKKGMRAIFSRTEFYRQREKLVHLTPEAALLAILAWEHELPQYAEKKEPLLEWVLETFVETAPKDFPFFTLYRTMLLLAATGTRHLDGVIRPGIDALLAEPGWRYPHNRLAMRHIKSTDDHVNVRGNGAMAILMRLFDLAAGRQVYTGGEHYRYLSGWMDRMRRPDGACYGCEDIPANRRQDPKVFGDQHLAGGKLYGHGSPAHYMQLWWILGGFFLGP